MICLDLDASIEDNTAGVSGDLGETPESAYKRVRALLQEATHHLPRRLAFSSDPAAAAAPTTAPTAATIAAADAVPASIKTSSNCSLTH